MCTANIYQKAVCMHVKAFGTLARIPVHIKVLNFLLSILQKEMAVAGSLNIQTLIKRFFMPGMRESYNPQVYLQQLYGMSMFPLKMANPPFV